MGAVLQFSESLVILTFVFQEKSQLLRDIFLVKEIICYTMGMLLKFTSLSTESYHFTLIFIPVGPIIMTLPLFSSVLEQFSPPIIFLLVRLPCPKSRWQRTNDNIHHSPTKECFCIRVCPTFIPLILAGEDPLCILVPFPRSIYGPHQL